MPKKSGDELKEQVLLFLKKELRGLTITQLSTLAKVSTITVSKSLAELKGEGKVEIRRAGSAKLHYFKSKRKKGKK